jgi:bacterioferritin-associated ferredoxin
MDNDIVVLRIEGRSIAKGIGPTEIRHLVSYALAHDIQDLTVSVAATKQCGPVCQ